MSADLDLEAQERYRRACERLEAVREAWEAAGRPMTAMSPRGVLAQHPLLRELRAHELLVDRLLVHAKRSRLGRPSVLPPSLPPPLEERRVRRVK